MEKSKINIDHLTSDRFKNETDHHGLDKNWSKMEQMLDHEDKNKYGFWNKTLASVGGLLLASGIATGSFLYYNNNVQNANKETIKSASKASYIVGEAGKHTADQSNEPTDDIRKQPNLIKNTEKAALNNSSKVRKTALNNGKSIAKITSAKSKVLKKVQALPNTVLLDESVIATTNTDIDKAILTQKNLKNAQENLKKLSVNKKLLLDKKNNIVKVSQSQEKHITVNQQRIFDHHQGTFSIVEDTIDIASKVKVDLLPLSPIEAVAIKEFDIHKSTALLGEGYPVLLTEKEYELAAPNITKSKTSSRSKSLLLSEKTDGLMNSINQFFIAQKRLSLQFKIGANSIAPKMLNNIGYDLEAAIFYPLNDRWKIGTGLQYSHISLNNQPITDLQTTYKTVSTANTPSGFITDFEKETSTNTYQLQPLRTFSLPIGVTYSHNKWEYHFGVKATRSSAITFTKGNRTVTSTDRVLTPTEEPGFSNTAFSYNDSTSFNSNWGLGYHFSLNYKLNEHLGVYSDFSHHVLNNSKNKGQNMVAKHALMQPKISFGVLIKLFKNTKVKYMLDDNER